MGNGIEHAKRTMRRVANDVAEEQLKSASVYEKGNPFGYSKKTIRDTGRKLSKRGMTPRYYNSLKGGEEDVLKSERGKEYSGMYATSGLKRIESGKSRRKRAYKR